MPYFLAVGLAVLISMLGVLVPNGHAQAPDVKRAQAPYSNPTDGPTMYRDYCAACHGAMGKGNGPAAPALKAVPTDLTRLAANNKGTFPADRFREILQHGTGTVIAHGSSDMPMWGRIFDRMNDPSGTLLRIRNLSMYVEQLQSK
jgi:mono/diheme cytochrome c family protein